jgi:hypothetical protein
MRKNTLMGGRYGEGERGEIQKGKYLRGERLLLGIVTRTERSPA